MAHPYSYPAASQPQYPPQQPQQQYPSQYPPQPQQPQQPYGSQGYSYPSAPQTQPQQMTYEEQKYPEPVTEGGIYPSFQPQRPNPANVEGIPETGEYTGELMKPQELESQLLTSKPKAPALWYTANGASFSMPLRRFDIETELHVATAFVRMKLTFVNTSGTKVNGLFVLPTDGTVTSCEVDVDNKRFFDTTYVDAGEAKRFTKKSKPQQENPIEKFIPGVFRFPVANVNANESITVEVDFIHELEYVDGYYHMNLPLAFAPGILPDRQQIAQFTSIKATINCLCPGMEYGSSSHQLRLTANENLRVVLYALPMHHNMTKSVDFHLAYRVQTPNITAAMLNDPPHEYEYDPKGSFVCCLNPPTQVPAVFPRDIIFLVDRSGSMTGKPYQDAARGLKFALSRLSPADRFGVVAFDHEQIFFNPGGNDSVNQPPQQPLIPFSNETKYMAEQFIDRNKARGLTNIETPLLWALDVLNQAHQQNPGRIPFLVLLTDGAVDGETEIVKKAQEQAKSVRILTFGIGQYCNWYFLKILALMSRGWNDGSLYPEQLYPKIRAMMDQSSAPILTDVQLVVHDVKNIELYPQTIPDLFIGKSVTIAGRYDGHLPSQVELRGTLGNGSPFSMVVNVDTSKVVPVRRVFLKQRMDQLTAKYWLTGNEKVKKEIVNLSVNESFPSPYTSMVAYEMTEEEKRKYDDKDGKKSVGKGKGKGLSGKKVAMLAGGAVVVGAGLVLAGSVAATMANSGGFGIGSVFGSGLFSGGCPCDGCCGAISCGALDCGDVAKTLSCGCCGDCDQCLNFIPCGDCGDCGDLPGCGFIGDCCDSIGNVFGDLFSGCDDVCGNVCSGLCGAFGSIGNCCGDVCGNVGDVCGNCGDICGGLGGLCGGLVGGIGDICGNMGDVCGALGGCCGEIVGLIGEILD